MNELVYSPGSCWRCENFLINNRAICHAASEEAMDELSRISHVRKYGKGQVIIGQGDVAGMVGNVISGIVKLTNISMSGQQQIVGLLYPSDFFGRAFSNQSRFSYEAATDVTLCCIDRQAFERFLERNPEIEHELLLSVLDELDASREWTAMISCHTTMQRVAAFLFVLSRRTPGTVCNGEDNRRHAIIALPIGRRDIAAYLGTTPETLSRNIQTLVRKKVIRPIDTTHFELLQARELVEHTGENREDLVALSGTRLN
ncbi:Crp/Fnr family transcriptional regulator [Oricola thermophila]|uniref:Crp/Fnr family transcriptional regulator n=1 Tax=Oricola thermophila TaxID=2742145 RepID=A0A6N1VB49_9HYPH|nr:Crp/Fnr family transcriptional regulator [Oricola thermophila]QKV18144.1 Crp/Fnr family transcriptional regulator [Oricola thermophila]